MNNSKLRFFAALLLASTIVMGIQFGALFAIVTLAAGAAAIANMSTGRVFGNSLGTLSSALILQEALDLAVRACPALKMVTTDFSAVPAKSGQTITSRVLSKPTVQNLGSAATAAADTDVTLTLGVPKEVRYSFTAAEINSTNRNLIRERAEPMSRAIVEYLSDLVTTVATTVASFGTELSVCAATAAEYSKLTEANRILTDDLQAPKGNRFGMVNPTGYEALLNDPLCNRAQKTDSEDPIKTAKLGMLAGFDEIFEVEGFPTTDNAWGFFGHKSSLLLAVRPVANPADLGVQFPGNIGYIQTGSPEAPFTVLATESVNPLTLAVDTVLAFYAAAAKGTAFGARAVSA